MAGIQFIGQENALLGYDSRGLNTWAIFQGKQMNASGNDRDSLENWLTMLSDSGGSSMYTLRVYANDPDCLTIVEKTDCQGSFNFKLVETSRQSNNGVGTGGVGFQEKLNYELRIKHLEEKIGALENDPGEKEETFKDVIFGWLKEPEQLVPVLQVIKGFFPSAAPAAAVAGIGIKDRGIDEQPKGTPKTMDEAATRLSAALDMLEKADPDIVIHLEKLALVAKNDPGTFKFLIKTLNTM